MSGMEIERKFLVKKGSDFKAQAYTHDRIKQGYICSGHGRTVRVRLRGDRAYLTIKGPSRDGGLSRYEFEKEIAVEEAEQLFALCEPGVVDKTRYLVKSGSHTFEVDEFYGDNAATAATTTAISGRIPISSGATYDELATTDIEQTAWSGEPPSRTTRRPYGVQARLRPADILGPFQAVAE